MKKSSTSAFALAIGLAFVAGDAMAQTTHFMGNSLDQPTMQPAVSDMMGDTFAYKPRSTIDDDYKTALQACKNLSRGARESCKDAAESQRRAAMAAMRDQQFAKRIR